MSLNEEIRNAACVACRSGTFTWGYVAGYAAAPLYFLPRKSGIKQLASNLLGKDGDRVITRKCDGCGNLQLFTEAATGE